MNPTTEPTSYFLTKAELALLQYLHTHSKLGSMTDSALWKRINAVRDEARLVFGNGTAYFAGCVYDLREPADLRRLADDLPYDTLHGGA